MHKSRDLFALFALFGVGSAAEVPCTQADDACVTSGNLIGTCSNATVCATDLSCRAVGTVAGTLCSEGTFNGKCSAKDGTCTYSAALACAATGQVCRDNHNLIGTCTNSTCSTADLCGGASVGTTCQVTAGNVTLTGTCSEKGGVCNGSTPPGMCDASDPKDTLCKNGRLLGKCSGGNSGNVCATSAVCLGKTANHACGDGDAMKGECVAAGGTCKYIPSNRCPQAAAQNSYCKNGMLVGKCNNASPKMCITSTSGCSTEGAPCGDGSTLKGECKDDDTCRYIPAGQCHQGAPKDSLCKNGQIRGRKGTFLGKCDDSDPKMCISAGMCADKDRYASCGGAALKGQCMSEGGRCLYIAPGQCDLSAMQSDLCKTPTPDGMRLGKCNDADPKMCIVVEDLCTDKVVGTSCGEGTTLKGQCVNTDGQCQYIAPGQCPINVATDNYCRNDTNDTLIGKCNSASPKMCITANMCAANSNDACGHSTDDKLKGQCGSGKCMAAKLVKVEYTIKADTTKAGGIKTELASTKFQSDFKTEVATLGAFSTMVAACAAQGTPTKGTLVDCSGPNFAGSSPCAMECDDGGYLTEIEHTHRCGADGQPTGVVGKCAKSCPLTDGVYANGLFTFKSATVNNGVLTCTDIFPSDPKTECELVCNDDFHPPTTIAPGAGYKCTVFSAADGSGGTTKTNTWTGNKGSCVATTELHNSARFVLKPGANHEKIIRRDDETFNDKFKESIATLQNVDIKNVMIVAIKEVPGRRLNERAVQVDYSIHVAKGEPEGTTELDKVEGGLRGIR